ncbi:uncharacterized protein TNIN_351931 [Trichonephila inaurata madagascariensis]|uniref:Uncharacterized protein n=1 Tax=Trichonephila inaurata madagascariensis TaxID=2747483 RepID=A0A8X6IR80_9ARAC|nr:uncharacterized protein TNIN_351931 [Trichonephila inaurata madagascariensis]
MKNRQLLVADGTECITKCKDDCASKLIKIEIYVDDSEIVTFRHRPQYLYIEAFSYVGGFIGIWLGISLIQLTDFIETLFRILRYSYKHKNDTQNE